MSIEHAAAYHLRRAILSEQRRTRQEVCDFRADCLSFTEIVESVGRGWRGLVYDLHWKLIASDPNYRLYEIGEAYGALQLEATFDGRGAEECRRMVALAQAKALATCEVCGAPGALRNERAHMKTLCQSCYHADRALASERGEWYAEITLEYLLSGDPHHPRPEDTASWVEN